MALIVRLKVGQPEKRKWASALPFLSSFGLHVGVVALLMSPIQFPGSGESFRLSRREATALAATPRSRIIWLRKGERFPTLNSGDQGALKLPWAPQRTRQVVFTSPKRAAEMKQFVFSELPKIEQQKPMPSPNLLSLATAMPAAPPPPPKPERRQFRAPESQQRKPAAAVELAESTALTAAPVPGQIPVLPSALSPSAARLPRPPARKFILPSGGQPGAGGGTGWMLDDAQALAQASQQGSAAGGTGTVTLAILSANPTGTAPPPGPFGNRPDAIQLGGDPGGSRSGGEGGGGGPTVPGLTIRGENGAAARAALPAAPEPRASAMAAAIPTRPGPLPPPVSTPTVSVPQWPNARRVPRTVETAFPDRPVYVTVLKPPGGSPDWILWFSDTTPSAPGVRVFMRPPVPRQLEWAARSEPLAALQETIWLRARLTKDGVLTAILPGDGREAESVAAAARMLGQSLFSPAVKNGVAVDSDVLFEIPLRRGR